MDFSDLIAIKIKELMNEQNITIYKLESLSGVYSSTITMFLTRKTKTFYDNQEYKYYTKAAQYYRDILIEEAKNGDIKNIVKPSFSNLLLITKVLDLSFDELILGLSLRT